MRVTANSPLQFILLLQGPRSTLSVVFGSRLHLKIKEGIVWDYIDLQLHLHHYQV